eukprot:GHVU01227551.1.p1 GENE.GHVU01227551.1~~GHVU01227551.1.p1  ORF type:complete len:202 (-),score=43.89 GHVU01227551.1:818-1423(-)
MGRIRTKTVKRAAREIVENYFHKLTKDFQINKKICEEVAEIPSKRLRNKIAGFATHVMFNLSRGKVRGISLKLQEEERERKLDTMPDKSAIQLDQIDVDRETHEMIKELGVIIPGLNIKDEQQNQRGGGQYGGQYGGGRGGGGGGGRGGGYGGGGGGYGGGGGGYGGGGGGYGGGGGGGGGGGFGPDRGGGGFGADRKQWQ